MESGAMEIDQDVYKVVALVDGRLLSIFDGVTEYVIGIRRDQLVLPGHGGGFYVSRTPEEALRAVFSLPKRSRLLLAPRVLLRCRAHGMCLPYGSGKIAVSGLTPLEARPVHSDVAATYAGRCRRQASSSRGRSSSSGPGRRPSVGEASPSRRSTDTAAGRLEWPARSSRLPRPSSARPVARPRMESAFRPPSRGPSYAAGQDSSRVPLLQVVAAR